MDEDVHNLVLAPFRGMVEKGTVAVEQMKDGGRITWEQTRKFARSLVKEGGRALKRIEPLCTKHWEEYGSNFVTALKENGNQKNQHNLHDKTLTDILQTR